MIGRTISHYRIIKKLRWEVAARVLPKGVSEDVLRLARFDLETQTVDALSDPNILATHDVGMERRVAFASGRKT